MDDYIYGKSCHGDIECIEQYQLVMVLIIRQWLFSMKFLMDPHKMNQHSLSPSLPLRC